MSGWLNGQVCSSAYELAATERRPKFVQVIRVNSYLFIIITFIIYNDFPRQIVEANPTFLPSCLLFSHSLAFIPLQPPFSPSP